MSLVADKRVLHVNCQSSKFASTFEAYWVVIWVSAIVCLPWGGDLFASVDAQGQVRRGQHPNIITSQHGLRWGVAGGLPATKSAVKMLSATRVIARCGNHRLTWVSICSEGTKTVKNGSAQTRCAQEILTSSIRLSQRNPLILTKWLSLEHSLFAVNASCCYAFAPPSLYSVINVYH